LYETWEIVLTGDLAKLPTPRLGRIELRAIECVEELGSELEAKSVLGTKPGVLEDGNVEVLDSIVADVRLSAGVVAVTIIRALREHGGVKPLS
jgi:hypothetical protein